MMPVMSDLPHPIRMVDVGGKPVTLRTARASARLRAAPETVRRIQAGDLAKGDAVAAALTIYDMCKSHDPGLTIEQVRLEEKTGGVRGDWRSST